MFEDVPEIWEKYDSFSLVAEGGMGRLYTARHKHLDETRVIKTIRHDVDNQDALLRFQREAQIAAKLRHPNIASIHDFLLTHDGRAFIIMEYLDGMNLYEYYHEGQRLAPEQSGLASQQILDALDYLHSQNLIHRDLSLDNVMVTRDGRGDTVFKLIDLGLAKSLDMTDFRTRSGIALGKVSYISPEELTHGSGSDKIDHRSDLYSFAVVLYQMLTGELPISGTDQASLIAGHLYREPKSFEITDPEGRLSPELRDLLLKALAKEPDDRFSTARELSEALIVALPTPGARSIQGRHQFEKTQALDTSPGSGKKWWRVWPLGLEAKLLLGTAVALLAVGLAWLGLPRLVNPEGDTSASGSERSTEMPAEIPSGVAVGRYVALLIGVEEYQKISPLDTPIDDVEAIEQVLTERYGFEVQTILDGSREVILDSLEELSESLSANDNLLVYYAGHGAQEGDAYFWLPADAEPENPANWISSRHEVTDILERSTARHVLVLADSCFAGAPFDYEPATHPIRDLFERPSRMFLTSGSLQPVLDNSGDGHSVFASVLLDVLSSQSSILSVEGLFDQLRQRVPREAAEQGVTQTPTLAALPRSVNDKGGLFFFIPRTPNDISSRWAETPHHLTLGAATLGPALN